MLAAAINGPHYLPDFFFGFDFDDASLGNGTADRFCGTAFL